MASMGQVNACANGQGNPPDGIVPNEFNAGRANDASRIDEWGPMPLHRRIFARGGIFRHKSALMDLVGKAVAAAANGLNMFVVT